MSLNINSVQLAGRLTRDPEVKAIGENRNVCNFSIAINNRYKTKDGVRKDDTTFIDVAAFGKTADLVGQYLSKGSACYIEGKLKLESWEKDGQRRQALKVIADNVQFLDSPRERATPPVAPVATARKSTPPNDDGFGDEPPF